MTWRRGNRSRWTKTALLLGLAGAFSSASLQTAGPEPRDPWLWPFAQNSIWNTPIGSGARYVPAGVVAARRTGVDTELLYQVPAGAPERPIYDPPSWSRRCGGQAVDDPKRRRSLPIPDRLIVPDATPRATPNNASAFLLPDGDTLVQLNPLARCVAGGPVYGWVTPDQSLRGPGVLGGHGATGLSSIGGSLRLGELLGPAPIRHALKINLWAERQYAYIADGTPGYRWPAIHADRYAARSYHGQVPALEIGALLAIPASVREADLDLRTPAARKLFHALQDYGAYTVSDSARDTIDLCVQQGVPEEFERAYGTALTGSSGPVHADLNRLYTALAVVDNNAPDQVGGGGQPRAPLAPPFR